ncbi:MAG TPA: beta-L-arabinofuranosidase domain-containing protein [Acidobacteriaceae bacterium]|jgi:DUF1680 family protein|nr:beta-L-arabinofuranosidase domain-containing protein [Acidobacteriaceae bacterium]
MSITRRKFVTGSAYLSTGIAARQMLWPHWLFAAEVPEYLALLHADDDRMAFASASDYRPYMAKPGSVDASSWVQVDLGSIQPIDMIKLYPAFQLGLAQRRGYGFPVRFKMEASDDPQFRSGHVIVDQTTSDFANPGDKITQYAVPGISARFIRLTATQFGPSVKKGGYSFALAKLGVLSSGNDIAVHGPVTADAVYGNSMDLEQLTRAPRPMGEGIVTDHPENLTSRTSWKPAAYEVNAPRHGVVLNGGVFQSVMENNIGYLLNSFSVDEMLRPFLQRAGKPIPPGVSTQATSWDNDLPGSCAGRFLMGSGNTLRWIDHPELRRRMNAVVDGIAECREPNGYIMAYPEDTIFYSERGNYTRAWVTHGLIEAGYAGNAKAFELLRGYYDWFDQRPYLSRMLRSATLGYQGMIANTRMYFTPAGKPEDIQVVQRYYQENYWLEGLAKKEDWTVWQYPYDRPHCYELTAFEAYVDLYRATGEREYLTAMLGAWQLYRDNWIAIGGSSSVIEGDNDPPGSYYLHRELGELCGSSFWTFLSQRLHLLYPEDERYVAEIEKSIYNVAMANQGGTQGLRYNTMLVGKKQEPTQVDTCCEGQGTRLLGSIPEHLYSVAPDGLYVNLYAASTIAWQQAGDSLKLTMTTQFPFQPDVQLHIAAAKPTQSKLHLRIPSWAINDMDIRINGNHAVTGISGTYTLLDRLWVDGDIVSFTLPAKFRLMRYMGLDQIPGHQRFALEYGPILMAAVGPPDATLKVRNGQHYQDLLTQLQPQPDHPLHFTIQHNPGIEYMPYWQVADQSFTCFPVIDIETENS